VVVFPELATRVACGEFRRWAFVLESE
jgi:hypothetical protein